MGSVNLALDTTQWSQLFEVIPDSITILDGQYRVREANAAAEVLLGLPRKQILGRKYHELLYRRQEPPPDCVVTVAKASGRSEHDEFWSKHLGRHLHSVAYPLLDDKGKTTDFILILRDVTEQKQAELKLAESELHFRGAFENAGVGVALVSLEGRFLKVNTYLCELLGYTEQELLARAFTEVTHPEDVEIGLQVLKSLVAGESKYPRFEKRYLTKAGGVVWALVSPSLLHDEQGRPLNFVTQIQDITARIEAERALKESEERYRQAVENSPNPIFSVDKEGLVCSWNRSCEQLFKRTSEQIMGESYQRLLWDPKEVDRVEAILAEVWQGEARNNLDLAYRCADNVPCHTLSRLYPVRDGSGRVTECVFANTNITQHKLAEERLQHRLVLEEAVARTSRLYFAAESADLNEVLAVLGKAVEANRAYIFAFREQGTKVDNTHEWCAPGTEPQIDNLQDLDSDLFPWWMELMHQDRNILIPDVEALPLEAAAEKELLQAQQIHSLLVVPIRSAAGELTGFMGFDDTQKCRDWLPEDGSYLRVAAEMVGLEWDRQQAKVALQRQLEELSVLHAVALAGTEVASEEDLIERVNRIIGERLYPENFGVLRLDEATGLLRDHHTYRKGEIIEPNDTRVGEGITGLVALDGQLRNVPDTRAEPAYIEVDPGTRSELCVPLKVGERIIGVINAESTRLAAFDASDERLLTTIAGQLATALEKVRLFAARAESEARLRSTLESLSDLLFVIDKEGRFVDYHLPEGGDNLYVPPEAFMGRTFHEVLPSEVADSLKTAMQAITKGAPFTEFEYSLRIEDQNDWYLARVTAHRDSNDKLTGFTVLTRNITQRKVLQHQLIQAERLGAIGQVAAGVAHEVNTPLASISVLCDNLRETTAEQETLASTEQIMDQVRFTAHIVKELLDFTSPPSLELEQVELQALLEAALAQLALPEWVQVEWQVETDLPGLQADRIKFQEILTNLIANSVDAMEGLPSPTLTLGLRRVEGGLELRVADTGCGIAEEVLLSLYQPFFTTKPTGKGTGLGLAITQRLVELHGWKLDITSGGVGQGTVATLTLPEMALRV